MQAASTALQEHADRPVIVKQVSRLFGQLARKSQYGSLIAGGGALQLAMRAVAINPAECAVDARCTVKPGAALP